MWCMCVTLRGTKSHLWLPFPLFLPPLLPLLLHDMEIRSPASSLSSYSFPNQITCTPLCPCHRHVQRRRFLFLNGQPCASMQIARHLLLHGKGRSNSIRRQNRRKNGSLVWASASSSSASSSAAMGTSASQSVSDVVWPASGAFVAMAAMSYLDKLIEPMGLTFTIAPFGAVCAVLFIAPNTPAAKKYNMFVAHIGCAALGVAAMGLFGPGWLARATSLSASLAFMHFTRAFHPPAAGLPLLFIDVPKFQKLQWWYIVFPSAIGCALLCLLQEAVEYLKRTYRF